MDTADALIAWFRAYNEQYPVAARLAYYESEAQLRLETEQDEAAREHLVNVGRQIPTARDALASGDVDRLVQAVERIVRSAVAAHIPDFERAAQRRRSAGNRSKAGQHGLLAQIVRAIGHPQPRAVAEFWARCRSADEADASIEEITWKNMLWAEQISRSPALSRLLYHYHDGTESHAIRYEALAQAVRRHRPPPK